MSRYGPSEHLHPIQVQCRKCNYEGGEKEFAFQRVSSGMLMTDSSLLIDGFKDVLSRDTTFRMMCEMYFHSTDISVLARNLCAFIQDSSNTYAVTLYGGVCPRCSAKQGLFVLDQEIALEAPLQ